MDEGISVQDLLVAWGRDWALNRPPNGYPSETTFARLARNPGTANVKVASLDPDEHSRIDAEVSTLKVRKPDHWHAIKLYYVDGYRDDMIAKIMKRSRSSARETRIAAEFWLDARLTD